MKIDFVNVSFAPVNFVEQNLFMKTDFVDIGEKFRLKRSLARRTRRRRRTEEVNVVET